MTRESLSTRLRDLGVLGRKHVPALYLRASYDQRLALLQGLVDSDGSIGRDGRASVTTIKADLRDGLVELLATLGLKSATREFVPRLNGRDIGVAWKVEFWVTVDVPVARLTRKSSRQRLAGDNSHRVCGTPRARLADTRRIRSVVRMPSVPVRCITVDNPTGLFLVGRKMVQTHNSKSECAGWVATAEAFLPVRFDGWDADGQPVARPVRSPLVKCLATEEMQAGATFRTIAFIAGEWGQDNHPEIYAGAGGVRRYQSASAIYLPQGGEIRACTAGSASKDGGLESHVVVDESHLYVLRELREMYATISRNLGKRFEADPWLQQTTTAYRPGEQSIAEQTLTAWRKGELPDSVYVNHREARGRVDIMDDDHTKAQLRDVYGAAADRIDLDRKLRDMRDPRQCPDPATAARYFLNRAMATADAWIAKDVHERQARPGDVVAPGEAVCLGFDGSLNDDTTVLRGCRVSDGFLFRIGAWPRPDGAAGIGWEVPRADVLATVREAYGRYDVVRAYFDPHEWRSDIDALAVEFGDRVVSWETRRDVQMAAALDRLHADLTNGVAWHDDDPLAGEHYGNAYVRRKGPHRLVRKEHPQSSRKIDSVVGDALAYEARADALAAGWSALPHDRRVVVFR